MVGPDISAADIAHRLGQNAEAVCRRYLSNGRRSGRYWLVGDAQNSPGRSLYVRLTSSPDGRCRAGKWTDAATGEHGDLLDIIGFSDGAASFADVLGEARRFLSLPPPAAAEDDKAWRSAVAPGSRAAARRLFAASRPIAGTLAERYLLARGLGELRRLSSLRYHPRCWYHPEDEDAAGTRDAWPALIAAVTDHGGNLTGVQRTWLDPERRGKAPVVSPCRAMGALLGHGVRFGKAGPVMAAGEGVETVLSLRRVLPDIPMIAGLSANHLAALVLPPGLARLYIARDKDPAGARAHAVLAARAAAAGVEARVLEPLREDFNADLQAFGAKCLTERIGRQLEPDDRIIYLAL